MSTIIVLNAGDSGAGSLRAAIAQAAATPEADTIFFDSGLTGATITLTSGPLAIVAGHGAVTIRANGAGHATGVTISGGDTTSILDVAAGATVTLNALVLSHGHAEGAVESGASAGGAITNAGTLKVMNSHISDNVAHGGSGRYRVYDSDGGSAAGGILNSGTLTVANTTFSNNTAQGGYGHHGAAGLPPLSGSPSNEGYAGGNGGAAAAGILNLAGGILALTGSSFADGSATGGEGGVGGTGGEGRYEVGYAHMGGRGGTGGNGGSSAHGVLNFGSVAGGATFSGGVAVPGLHGNGGAGGDGGQGEFETGQPGSPGDNGFDGIAGGLLLSFGTGGADTHAGFTGPETFFAGGGADTISGAGGIDYLYGQAGDDRLTGDRADNVFGGEGNDTIIVSFVQGNGIFDGGAGNGDTIDLSFSPGVTGTYNLAAVSFTTDRGGTFSGFEHVTGSASGETIIGNAASNRLAGGGGNDTLGGGGGFDTLNGGAGDDVYVSVSLGGPSNDTIFEDPGGGTDTVESKLSFSLAGIANVENLLLLDTGSIDGSGNELANLIVGNAGNNRLNGAAGNDTLEGNAGNDRLGGGAGADVMRGGAGDDIYINPVLSGAGADTIEEMAGGGTDTVQSDATLSIADTPNVERLDLTGTADINGTGNQLANLISGNSGMNILSGGSGADTLNGGPGRDVLIGGKGNDLMNGGSEADTFRFAVTQTNTDTIVGFELALDRFDLSGGAFTSRTEAAGNTTLTHAGGTIVIAGVTGLTLTAWNTLVLPAGGTASEFAASGAHTGQAAEHVALLQNPTIHLAHGDWFSA